MEGNFLHELVSPEHPALDIVAVHGLNVWGTDDHGNKCWTDNETGTNWLRDLLPTRLPEARVLVFHYNSNIIRNAATTGVEEHALNLLNSLWLKREEASARPIIFIAHSLGGLVVKEALVKASDTDGRYASIWSFTYGIAFFGTPHRGSDIVQWASMMTRMYRFIDLQPENDLEDCLDAWGLTNGSLREKFEVLLQLYHFISIYETRPQAFGNTRVMKEPIVPMDSALLGLAHSQETVIGLNRDHSSLCKFKSIDDGEFEQVMGNISKMAMAAITSLEYTLAYNEAAESFQRQRVHAPGTGEVLSVAEAVQLGTRVRDSLSEDRQSLDQIDRELASIRDDNHRVAFVIAALITSFAGALSACFSIPLLTILAMTCTGGVFLSQLTPHLEIANRTARQNLEWSQFSVEILAEKQSTVLRTIQHLRLAQEDVRQPNSPQLLQESSELQTVLGDAAVSINAELHQRATQAALAKRQVMAASQAAAVQAHTAQAFSSGQSIFEALRDLFSTLLQLVQCLLEDIVSIVGNLIHGLVDVVSSILSAIGSSIS